MAWVPLPHLSTPAAAGNGHASEAAAHLASVTGHRIATTVKFDRNSAVRYAAEYWNVVTSDGYFWDSSGSYVLLAPGTNVVNMTGDDCAHFASSVIGNESHQAGGGLNIPSRVPPTYGEPGAGALGDLVINDGWGVVAPNVSQLMPGDLINYEWTSGAGWGHIAVYLGNGTVATHTNSHYGAGWTLGGAYAYRFIHILTPANAPGIASFTAVPNNFTVGTSTTLSVSVTGGTPPYSYVYSGLPGGCLSSNTSALVCTPAAQGSYSVAVTVLDAQGMSANRSVAFTVDSLPPTGPSISAFVASPSTLPLGGTSYLNLSVSGGTPPYTYSYAQLPSGCSSVNTATLSCQPSVTGNFSISATVTDAASRTARAVAGLHVTVPGSTLSVTGFEALPSAVPLGSSLTLTVNVSGGVLPYAYAYGNLPPGCPSLNQPLLTCTPTVAGTFSPSVSITDAQGGTASASTLVIVDPALSNPPSITSLSISPLVSQVGRVTYINVTASGGSPPYVYAYAGLPEGCTSLDTPFLSCAPTSPGSFHLKVYANDSHGLAATPASGTLTVQGSPGGSPPEGGSGNPGQTVGGMPVLAWVMIVTVIGLILGLVAVVVRRRRAPPPPEEPGTGPYL